MGAITATLGESTEFAGSKKLVALTATVASSDDSMTLTAATHGISSLDSIVGAVVTGGLDAAFSYIQVTISDAANMIIQVKSFEQDGTAATDFTGTTIALSVIGNV
jgi:hypothetical protein